MLEVLFCSSRIFWSVLICYSRYCSCLWSLENLSYNHQIAAGVHVFWSRTPEIPTLNYWLLTWDFRTWSNKHCIMGRVGASSFFFLSFFLSFFLLDHQETLAALTVTFNVMQRNRLFLSCKQKDNEMILTQSGRNDPKVKRHAPGKKEKQLTFHFYVCESKCTVTHTLAQGQLRDCTGDRIIFFFPNCFASQIFI